MLNANANASIIFFIDIFILEFSARTGGGVNHELIKRISGFDTIKAVVDLTLGVLPKVEIKKPQNKYIVDEFIYCKPGVFDHLQNFDELLQKDVISNYFLFRAPRSTFNTVENSGDRIAGFTVKADTLEVLQEKHNCAVRELMVIDENGKDIMRHDLLTEIKYNLI